MGSYVPGTKQEQQEMLREIGYVSFEEMFSHIPDEVMLKEGVNIPSGLSEQAVKARMEDIAGKNVAHITCRFADIAAGQSECA